MYHYSSGMNGASSPFTPKVRRILAAVMVLLLIGCIVLTVMVVRTRVFEQKTAAQLSQRMMSSVSAAIEQVNKMSSVVNSGTSARLALIRQYVYAMEQFNQMSVSLWGEGGRLAPVEAFTALYSDIDNIENLTQAAASSTLDARTLLLTHLTNLQEWLSQPQ